MNTFSFASRGLLVLGIFISLVSNGLAQHRAPSPNPRHGDGRVSAFYTWEAEIPSSPGRLLRAELLESTVGLASAGQQWRILFTSTDGVGGKEPIVVSGALFLPRGTPPSGGWPLVAWGHGTLGGADICAPSWQGRSYRDVRYLNRWLEEGFAVVASDYQGIGVPGPNPQFNNRSNAYTILDSARAALTGIPGLANKVLLIGQSQGGSAVVAALGYAPEYAPELGVLGAVGTGIVYAPGRPVPPLKSGNPSGNQDRKGDPTIAYSFFHAIAAESQDPTYKVSDVYTDLALPLVDQARVACLATLTGDVAGLGLTRATAFKSGASQSSAGDDVNRAFHTLKFAAPLFIGAGKEDSLAAVDIALAKDACAAGTTVEIHVYPDRDHSGAVNESLRHSIPFAKKLLAGKPIVPVCKPPELR
ncbi:MAG: lipase family protein [Zoogloeaceae bacterium]|jgi:pimeloyl-ACP methyl ester carboxylesterase|nr:lipase family protein [Zoogloeaceae bacterium]